MLFSADRTESLMYSYFHEFYSEVVRLKKMIKSGNLVSLEDQTDEDNITSITPHYVHQQLAPLLEQQRMDASQRGGEYGATLYREAQYLMVGLADEIFLHLVAWNGQEVWRGNLLESRLFDSYIAGQKIFRNIDKLLEERNPVYTELARIYLISLSLGFQGKYRGDTDQSELESYKHRLFAFITQRDPDGLHEYLHFNESKQVFPDAYSYTIEESASRPLPSLRLWFVGVGLVAIIVLLTSHFLWQYYIKDIDALTTEILLQRDF